MFRASTMQIALNRPFSRLSLTRQFLLLSLVALTICMLAIGTWLSRQIVTNAVNRAASIAAVYVESILVAQLHGRMAAETLDDTTHAILDRVFVEGPLNRKVVRFKLWDAGGKILYSSDHAQLGRRYAVVGLLAAAFGGEVQARMSELNEADNPSEREHWTHLLEVYVPVRMGSRDEVTAVAEFYHSTENLLRDIRVAQRNSWILVALAAVAVYILLLGLMLRANSTIIGQQRDLQRRVVELRAALDDNERMRERLREAGSRTTALNEQFLQRLAADLHDGPAQDTALALLRIDEMTADWGGRDKDRDFKTVRKALATSLDELRAIASALRMPDIESLSLTDTVLRAVRDYERRTACKVVTVIETLPVAVSFAVKITVYRLIQEALANGWWHARGSPQQVRVHGADGKVLAEIADQGPGFDPEKAAAGRRLGLAFMRERVRLLGGDLEIDSASGCGTCVRAVLPLSLGDTVNG